MDTNKANIQSPIKRYNRAAAGHMTCSDGPRTLTKYRQEAASQFGNMQPVLEVGNCRARDILMELE
jgi:hypothetical protein